VADFLPIFPLPEVVLLPRAVMPLHIFEERYKSMTTDALATDGRIALARLLPGWDKRPTSIPPIEEVICTGKILSHERLPDGRYNFLLQGESRVRVLREERIGLYRAAEVEPLAEPTVMEIDVADLRQRMLRLFTGPLARTQLGPQFEQLLRSIISTTDAADVIAFHCLPDASEKQLMLEEPNARLRIARLANQLDLIARSLSAQPEGNGPGISLN